MEGQTRHGATHWQTADRGVTPSATAIVVVSHHTETDTIISLGQIVASQLSLIASVPPPLQLQL